MKKLILKIAGLVTALVGMGLAAGAATSWQ